MKLSFLISNCDSRLLVPVQTIAEDGPEVFNMRDEKGHTPAHWACLGGHMTILRFIMDSKGPIDQPSNNELGAHPIHWACVNGHINIVDILLQYGVNIDTTDLKGCTPLIVACQYGHTMMAGYLMGKGSRLQMVDKDGDNALHWASFKGMGYMNHQFYYSLKSECLVWSNHEIVNVRGITSGNILLINVCL